MRSSEPLGMIWLLNFELMCLDLHLHCIASEVTLHGMTQGLFGV